MGMDWTAFIVKGDKILAKTEDLFDGRNSDWFANLQGNGLDNCYDYLPVKYNWDIAPAELKEKYSEDWYFDHRSIQIKDFKEWFHSYQPYKQAGWMRNYDAWELKTKHTYNYEDKLQRYLGVDENMADWEWVEFIDEWALTYQLYNFMEEYQIPDDAYLIYCFDW